MKRIYSICALLEKDGTYKGGQIIGNDVIRNDCHSVHCVGGAVFYNILPDLTFEEGNVLCEAKIELQPFDGYTHEAWIYGAHCCARISNKEPRYSRKRKSDGTRFIFASGDWWLSPWASSKDFFPERNGNIVKCFLKVTRAPKAKRESL